MSKSISYRSRSKGIKAVQFNGKNTREILDFVKGHGYEAKGGGGWVAIQVPGQHVWDMRLIDGKHKFVEAKTEDQKVIVSRGDVVVFSNPDIEVFTYDVFAHLFVISKHHPIEVPKSSKLPVA